MAEQPQQLKIFFLPMMAQGHIVRHIEMAKIFSASTTPSGGSVKSTIITTPLNSITISNSIQHSSNIDIMVLDFPSTAVTGLPEGIENTDQCTSYDMIIKFIRAVARFEEPFEKLLEELRPDCVIADMFFPWATTCATKYSIPRLAFNTGSVFALCATKSVTLYKPFMEVKSDSEQFVVPALPHQIKLTRSQLAPYELNPKFSIDPAKDDNLHCYGLITNSFYDVEPDYINHFENIWKQKVWHIGPVSLFNKSTENKSARGKNTAIDESECLKWLNSHKPNSVIYICFGSEAYLPPTQLHQLALGLEASDQPFIWVLRKNENDDQEDKWMPKGFEERLKGKGLIIRGWAPQVMILEHESVGGFVTHCGWNSILEAISCGLPMVTWPNFVDQFYNEKFVTDVLKIGVSVGVKEWSRVGFKECSEDVKGEVIEKAIKAIMAGEEGDEMRKKVKELKEKAFMAVEEGGGSSKNSLNELIEDLCLLKLSGKGAKKGHYCGVCTSSCTLLQD